MKLLLLVLLFICSSGAAAQAPNPKPPVFGVHYTFERLVADRTVDDKFDKGTVHLVSLVYHPLKTNNGQVVVILHGSTGGQAIDPREPYLGPAPPLGFFMERGYTVIIPMRRGRAESTGQYVEECAFQAGKCSLADAREQTEFGLTDAVESTGAVLQQIVFPRLKPKGGRVILWGSSRGGILAFRYAALHPQEVSGIVAVSPGWLSMPDKWSAPENAARLALQSTILSDAAKTYKGPSIWVYADGDHFYPESRTRPLFEAYKAAGGQGRYVQIGDHKLPNAHVPPVELWTADADSFLRSIE